MKTLILILISFSAFAQQPDVAGDILHPGVPIIPIIPVQPALGKAYLFKYEKGTAILPETVPDGTWILIKFNKAGSDTTVVPAPAIQRVDGEALTFSSDWQRHGATTDTSWYAKTIAYSTTGSATYNFNGKGIAVYGESKPTHGTGEIRIDSVGHTVNWNTAPFGVPVKVFEKNLPPGNHKITIRPLSGVILLDYLVIEK
jgi:hypothetical protein